MTTVLLILHLMIATALVGVVLLQRSEGGALGIGGGGGFMTGRGAANFLTRVTAGLAAAFFSTSLLLTLLAAHTERAPSVFDAPASAPSAPSPGIPAAPAAGAQPAAWRSSRQARSGAERPARASVAVTDRGLDPIALRCGTAMVKPSLPSFATAQRNAVDGQKKCASNRGLPLYSAGPWRGISSSPAAWSLRSEKGWHRRLWERFCKPVATRSGSASSTLISMSIPAP